MNGACRVCPQCDGKACAGELPGMGGIRTGASFRANVSALEKICLKMRLIHEVRAPETACEVLGLSLSMPVLIAPLAGTTFNMGNGLPEERFARWSRKEPVPPGPFPVPATARPKCSAVG